MTLPAATVNIGLSLASALVKLGGRLDQIVAGQAATRSPLAFPNAVQIRPPSVGDMTDILSQYVAEQQGMPVAEREVTAEDLDLIEQAIANPNRVEATLVPVMEDFVPDRLKFEIKDDAAWAATALTAFGEEGLAPLDSEQAGIELLYFLGPGADRREQGLPWQIGTTVFGTLAEFTVQNQQTLIRDEASRALISTLLTRLATRELLAIADGRMLVRHVLKATLNAVVDVREDIDQDNPWLEALFDALADARAAQPEAERNDYLVGLLSGRGYKAFVTELIEEGAEQLGDEEAPAYHKVLAEVLKEAATRARAAPDTANVELFFQEHWTDLARAGLKSVEVHGPVLLEGTAPLLKESLIAAVGALAETNQRRLFTSESLILATEAAIAAVAARPELFGDEQGAAWMKTFYGGFAAIVADAGLRKTFSGQGISRIAQEIAGRLAEQPQLLFEDPGLAQELAAQILKKIADSPSLSSEMLATAAIDAALSAVADNPHLLKKGDAQPTTFAQVIAAIAGPVAELVREQTLSGIRGADLLETVIRAVASNPELYTEIQPELARLIVARIVEAAAEDRMNLLTGDAVVALVDTVLTVIAQRGRALLVGGSAAVLADRITVVIKAGLEAAGKELGRQLDRPAVVLVVGLLVEAWARGEVEDVRIDDAGFQLLFSQLADRATRSATTLPIVEGTTS